jgi:NhaP-type Na+/H+ or K+/H+ antiporter
MPSPQLPSVVRLIIIGVLIRWPLAAAVAALLLGMSPGAAVMIGVILVVSGPTVTPVAGSGRPTGPAPSAGPASAQGRISGITLHG